MGTNHQSSGGSKLESVSTDVLGKGHIFLQSRGVSCKDLQLGEGGVVIPVVIVLGRIPRDGGSKRAGQNRLRRAWWCFKESLVGFNAT